MKKEDENKNILTFLGTGGGGNVTYFQVRATGGLHLLLDNLPILIDPGPGSLIWLRKMKLREPELLLLSHIHVDHASDVNIILDGMKNPRIIAEKHCLELSEKYYPCVSKYHQSIASFIKSVEGGEVISSEEMKLNKYNIKIFVAKSEHHAPCVGFKIVGSRAIGYPSDGVYYENQEKSFENCDLIIFNVLIPYGGYRNDSEKKHMSVSDIINFLNSMKNDVKPKVVILQHFSFYMIKNNVYKQAKIVEENTGIKTIASKDFMQIDLDTLEILQKKRIDLGLKEFI
ncbi:MAG: MBL fold metallo-hydrolase [Candidatus Aenigmatarchaeota archaeon]